MPKIIERKDFANEAVGNFYIGKALLALDKEQEALRYMQKVYDAYKTQGYIRPDLREAFEILISYYKKEGNLKMQLRYIETLLQAETLINKENNFLSRKIHKDFDTKRLLDEKQQIEKSFQRTKIITYLVSVLSVITILYFIYRHIALKKFYDTRYKEIMQASSEKIEEIIPEKQDKVIYSDINNKPYIPQDAIDDILDKLDYFESEKLFLDSSLGQEELEKLFGYNRRYISLVILNEKKFKFLDYLNDLKIKYVIKKLKSDRSWRRYGNEALAKEGGFTSGKIFSRTFKKIAEIPLMLFIKKLDEQDKLPPL